MICLSIFVDNFYCYANKQILKGPDMTKFGTNQSVKRIEDPKLLKGKGKFVDDICPKNSKVMFFLRSPMAHAKIKDLNIEGAINAPGVIAVYTAQSLQDNLINSMEFDTVINKDGKCAASPRRPLLAEKVVRFVGEAIVAIVANTKQEAMDASELIEIDFEDLDAHLATAVGGNTIHSEAKNNTAVDWHFGNYENVKMAFKHATYDVSLDLIDNRVFANPIETRGCFAQMEQSRLHFCFSGQGVWNTKAALAKILRLKETEIKVTTPDVGGGFGMKGFDSPEYFLVAFAAKELGECVKWQADRTEAILSDNGARDLLTNARVAFDETYKITALKVKTTFNLGAYNSKFGQKIQTELALKVITGVYDIQNLYVEVKGVYTNTTPIDAYRGAGRPEAIYIIERLMDYSARVLNVDHLELRQQNFIKPDMFPYKTASGEIYDVGNFHKLLEEAKIVADLKNFKSRKKISESNGLLRGIGLSFYIESILGSQEETTTIEFTNDGHVSLYVGTQSNGQGHETVYSQILNEKFGIQFEKINFVQGDSDQIVKGGGTGGSRSVTMQGNSINATAELVIKNFRIAAARYFEVDASKINFSEGSFNTPGKNRFINIIDLAKKAEFLGMPEIRKTTLENVVEGRSYPYGAHFAEVEIDPETGSVKCVKYTVVDDFGILMNPMLVEGQIHGGVAQGIGQALIEHVVHDDYGQLLSGSLMDYAMPRADTIPTITFDTYLIPSIANKIGMKGCGEAGTVGALAAVANATLDAVYEIGVERVDMPFTPSRMWSYMAACK